MTKKEKKRSYSSPKEELDESELQLFEAVQNRAILEPLEEYKALSLGEIQHQIKQRKMMKDLPKKSTVATKISRLKSAGLVRRQSKLILPEERGDPQYRGWRVSEQKNGSLKATLGFELTKNGKEALETIRGYTSKKRKIKKEGKKNE